MDGLGFASASPLGVRRADTQLTCSLRARRHQVVRMTTVQNEASTALITGASGGIGAETALGLRAVMPTLKRVILAARNTEKAEDVAERVRKTGLDVDVVHVELGNLASTRACAKSVRDLLAGSPLDLLINNAGVMACPLMYTDDGVELQYGVNHIAAAALTDELLPALRASDSGRVVFVSSMALALAKDLKEAPVIGRKLKGQLDESKYGKWECYGESKLAMSMFAKALSEREKGLTVLSLHPGVVQTDLGRYLVPKALTSLTNSSGVMKGLVNGFFSLFGLLTPKEGAQMSLELSSASKFSIESGAFYAAPNFRQPPRTVAPMLTKADMCERVYDSTMRYIRDKA